MAARMSSPGREVDNTILLEFVPNLHDLGLLGEAITNAAIKTRKNLLIILTSLHFDPAKRAIPFLPLQRLLTYSYVQAARVAHDRDNILLNVNVVLHWPDGGLERLAKLRYDWDQIIIPDGRK